MTISSQTIRNEYTGNGTQTVFPYTFKVFDDDDIAVYVDGVLQTKTTQYSVSGVGEESGGNITFVSTPTDYTPDNGASVVLILDVDLLQSIDYVEGDDFAPETHERGLDKLTQISLMLKEMIGRAALLNIHSTYENLSLPDPEDGKYLAWKSDLSGLKNVSLQTTGLSVSSFIETLLDDADAATARKTLALAAQFPGYLQRPKFRYKDADEIYIGPAVYHHHGTIEQLVYWISELTFQFGPGGSNAASDALGANHWHYLYIDDSALAGSPVITAAKLLNKTTAPTFNAAKGGFYNGDDRCLFAIKTDVSNNIREFYHDGGRFFNFADFIEELNNGDIDALWTDLDLTSSMPAFAIRARLMFWLDADGETNGGQLSWRTNNQAGTAGHIVGYAKSGEVEHNISVTEVMTDDAQVIELYVNYDGGHKVSVDTQGWYLPVGM